jgi:hypothetical protein
LGWCFVVLLDNMGVGGWVGALWYWWIIWGLGVGLGLCGRGGYLGVGCPVGALWYCWIIWVLPILLLLCGTVCNILIAVSITYC